MIIQLCVMKSPVTKGVLGERKVSFLLSSLDRSEYKVINNLMIKAGSQTTQIDHVVVSPYGIFVIETKNYHGWIIGGEYSQYWYQIIYKRKERLYNPIRQNYGHIQVLKNVLKEFNDINYISIVVFSDRAVLKVRTSANIVKASSLLWTIKQYNDINISAYEVETLFNKLKDINIDSPPNRKTHVANLQRDAYVRKTKINNGICPKCGSQLVPRHGKYGPFIGCSNYPVCRFTTKH